jgi:hypothetical protein
MSTLSFSNEYFSSIYNSLKRDRGAYHDHNDGELVNLLKDLHQNNLKAFNQRYDLSENESFRLSSRTITQDKFQLYKNLESLQYNLDDHQSEELNKLINSLRKYLVSLALFTKTNTYLPTLTFIKIEKFLSNPGNFRSSLIWLRSSNEKGFDDYTYNSNNKPFYGIYRLLGVAHTKYRTIKKLRFKKYQYQTRVDDPLTILDVISYLEIINSSIHHDLIKTLIAKLEQFFIESTEIYQKAAWGDFKS